jgi:hypothetical protein
MHLLPNFFLQPLGILIEKVVWTRFFPFVSFATTNVTEIRAVERTLGINASNNNKDLKTTLEGWRGSTKPWGRDSHRSIFSP